MPPALGVLLDVADPTSITAAQKTIRESLGRVDVLINNAGISVGGEIEDEEFDDRWQLALDVMLTPHQRLIRACLDDLKASGEGRVINISSTSYVTGAVIAVDGGQTMKND